MKALAWLLCIVGGIILLASIVIVAANIHYINWDGQTYNMHITPAVPLIGVGLAAAGGYILTMGK